MPRSGPASLVISDVIMQPRRIAETKKIHTVRLTLYLTIGRSEKLRSPKRLKDAGGDEASHEHGGQTDKAVDYREARCYRWLPTEYFAIMIKKPRLWRFE